ncbi:MAG: AraC family transcriptional regulator [Bacteroidota bacterium]
MLINYQHLDLINKVVFEHLTFTPPLRATQEMESEACYIYVVKGSSIAYGGKHQVQLHQNESVLMRCGNYLNVWNDCRDGESCEAVAIHLYPSVLEYVYKNEIPSFLKKSKMSKGTRIQKIKVQAAVDNYIQGLFFYFNNPSMVDEDMVMLKVKELMMLLYNTGQESILDLLENLLDPMKIEFKAVVKNNIFSDLSLEELALLTNLSLSSFKRKFKEIYQESPARYIKNKRLEHALELLKISTNRISDVCYDCGFKDVGHFSKSFIAAYGQSPSDYRKAVLVN